MTNAIFFKRIERNASRNNEVAQEFKLQPQHMVGGEVRILVPEQGQQLQWNEHEQISPALLLLMPEHPGQSRVAADRDHQENHERHRTYAQQQKQTEAQKRELVEEHQRLWTHTAKAEAQKQQNRQRTEEQFPKSEFGEVHGAVEGL